MQDPDDKGSFLKCKSRFYKKLGAARQKNFSLY